MKKINQNIISLFGSQAIEINEKNGKKIIKNKFRLLQNLSLHKMKVINFFKNLKGIYKECSGKDFGLVLYKKEYLEVFCESFLKIDLIQFNLDFWNSNLTVDFRGQLLPLISKFRMKILLVLDILFDKIISYDDLLPCRGTEVIQVFTKCIKKLYDLEDQTQKELISMVDGDSSNLYLVYFGFVFILIFDVIYKFNELKDLNFEDHEIISTEQFYQRICKYPLFDKSSINLKFEMFSFDTTVISESIELFNQIKNNINNESQQISLKNKMNKLHMNNLKKIKHYPENIRIIVEMFKAALSKIIHYALVDQKVYAKFSKTYANIKTYETYSLITHYFLSLSHISLRWILDIDPNFPFLVYILEGVHKFHDRLSINTRMKVVDSILQILFYQEMNVLGINNF
jgi:hypothetical protein